MLYDMKYFTVKGKMCGIHYATYVRKGRQPASQAHEIEHATTEKCAGRKEKSCGGGWLVSSVTVSYCDAHAGADGVEFTTKVSVRFDDSIPKCNLASLLTLN